MVRLMIILACIHNWNTQSVDLLNDFYQSNIPKDEPIYIEIHTEFELINGEVLVLNIHRSIYGQSEALRMLYQKLKSGLEAICFKNSGVDL